MEFARTTVKNIALQLAATGKTIETSDQFVNQTLTALLYIKFLIIIIALSHSYGEWGFMGGSCVFLWLFFYGIVLQIDQDRERARTQNPPVNRRNKSPEPEPM